MKRPTSKTSKTRRVRSAASPKKKRAKRARTIEVIPLDLASMGPLGDALSSIIGQLIGGDPRGQAPTVKLTKYDEHYAMETREYTCDCGKAGCPGNGYMTTATRDGFQIPGVALRKAATMKEVEEQHVIGIKAIRDGLAGRQVDAHKDLAHALGNCSCSGKEGPKA